NQDQDQKPGPAAHIAASTDDEVSAGGSSSSPKARSENSRRQRVTSMWLTRLRSALMRWRVSAGSISSAVRSAAATRAGLLGLTSSASGSTSAAPDSELKTTAPSSLMRAAMYSSTGRLMPSRSGVASTTSEPT